MFLFGIKFIQTLWGSFLLMKIAAQNSCYIFYFLLENRIKIFWDVLYLEVIVNSNSWEIIPFWRVSRSVYFSLKIINRLYQWKIGFIFKVFLVSFVYWDSFFLVLYSINISLWLIWQRQKLHGYNGPHLF